MPVTYVKRLAKKHHTSVNRSEKRWKEAKDLARRAGMTNNYAYITGIYKRMMGESAKSVKLILSILEGALVVNPELVKSLRSNIFRYFSNLRRTKGKIVTQEFSNILFKTLYSFDSVSAKPYSYPPENVVSGFLTNLIDTKKAFVAEFVISKGEGYIIVNIDQGMCQDLVGDRSVQQFLENNINRLVETIVHEIVHAMQYYSVKLSAGPKDDLFDLINRFSDGIPLEKRDKKNPWLFRDNMDKKEIMAAASQLALESIRVQNNLGYHGNWKNSFYIRHLISSIINNDDKGVELSTICNRSVYIQHIMGLPQDSPDKKRFLKYLYQYLDQYSEDQEVSGYKHSINKKIVFPSYGHRSRYKKLYDVGNKFLSRFGK